MEGGGKKKRARVHFPKGVKKDKLLHMVNRIQLGSALCFFSKSKQNCLFIGGLGWIENRK